jgi:hypothetical protein
MSTTRSGAGARKVAIAAVPGSLRWAQSIPGWIALLVLAGCVSVSPTHVTTDRMDYGQVVAES